MPDKKKLQELIELSKESIEANDHAIEQTERVISIAEGLLKDLEPKIPVTNIQVEWKKEKLFEVTWDSEGEGIKLDIQFYDPSKHEPWQLSVLKYHPNSTLLSEKESHPIGLGGSDTDKNLWRIRIVKEDGSWASEPIPLPPREEDEDDEDEEEGKLITVFDKQYARIRGVINWKGKTRIYAHIADGSGGNAKGIQAFDSKDLENWEQSPKPEFPLYMNIFQDPEDGEIYGFTNEGDETFLWDNFNPDKGCQRKRNKMYEWRQDGTHPPTKLKNGFIQLGRVRGYGSEDKGRWDYNNIPPYPKIKDYPKMLKAWEKRGNVELGKRWLKDRRGLSLHISEDGKDWDSEIILDPKDVDLKGFRGWKDPNKNGIADFYSGDMIDERRAFIKVYWKEKDRFIDRFDYVDEDKQDDYDLRRRFRFTGETTFIPAILEDGKIKITSTESIIPKKFHERIVTTDQVPWATRPGVPEVGQLTSYGDVIFRDGYAFIFYIYRDDIHYEGGWDKQGEGIFIYKMPEKEFDSLFE